MRVKWIKKHPSYSIVCYLQYEGGKSPGHSVAWCAQTHQWNHREQSCDRIKGTECEPQPSSWIMSIHPSVLRPTSVSKFINQKEAQEVKVAVSGSGSAAPSWMGSKSLESQNHLGWKRVPRSLIQPWTYWSPKAGWFGPPGLTWPRGVKCLQIPAKSAELGAVGMCRSCAESCFIQAAGDLPPRLPCHPPARELSWKRGSLLSIFCVISWLYAWRAKPLQIYRASQPKMLIKTPVCQK